MQQHAPLGGEPSRDEMMVGYFDRMSMSMNWISGTMENMIHIFTLNNHLTWKFNTKFSFHGASTGQGKETEQGLAEHEMTKMKNDVYPFTFGLIL